MRQQLSEQHLQSAAHHECPPRMAMPFRPLPPLQHARTHTHTKRKFRDKGCSLPY